MAPKILPGYMENPIPEIQIRAFESMYFCTLGACAPELWSDLDILARMVRAAGQAQSVAEENSAVPGTRSDGGRAIKNRLNTGCVKGEHVEIMTSNSDSASFFWVFSEKTLQVFGFYTKVPLVYTKVPPLATQDVLLRKHADALWEISLRALHHCLQYEVGRTVDCSSFLVPVVGRIPIPTRKK